MRVSTRIVAFLFNFFSMSAVAGYECTLQLAHSEDLHQVIAEKVVSIRTSEMSFGDAGTLIIEHQQGRRKTELVLRAMMSGWSGEEDATFVVLRKTSTRRNASSAAISEKFTVTGNSHLRGWFDSYKLEIDCRVKES